MQTPPTALCQGVTGSRHALNKRVQPPRWCATNPRRGVSSDTPPGGPPECSTDGGSRTMAGLASPVRGNFCLHRARFSVTTMRGDLRRGRLGRHLEGEGCDDGGVVDAAGAEPDAVEAVLLAEQTAEAAFARHREVRLDGQQDACAHGDAVADEAVRVPGSVEV